MKRGYLLLPACIGVVGLAAALGFSEPQKDPKALAPAGMPEMKLPPGWTAEDMQTCMMASTPGKMHEYLAKAAGKWSGKCQNWMAPGTEALVSDCVATSTPVMDGRFVKTEFAGEMMGMPFNGFSLNGYDNVGQKFQAVWVDNMTTGMMVGTGELSADGKTMTWNYQTNCPLTKKPTTMREIETITGPNSKTLEMWGIDPKSGKEYKCTFIEFKKQS
ncbi:MAG: DUF1579 domain-containing protein [Phycisphaerales bacterium]|nr:DUF1579 domain-containing protein [Planctomycetota bacterium]